MRFAVNLRGGSPESKARAIQDLFRATARYYRTLRLVHPLPQLYETNIVYRIPPYTIIDGHAGQELADPWTVLERGYGDCGHLCMYRATELSDDQFQPEIYWRLPSFHIALYRPDLGTVEDPSLILLRKNSDAP